ncbi:hypothetical protein PLESTF_000901700 [Pleodorina starrii]|nr:hypothetical protein PLESTF_000901700 [Pleodorina starrii]
MTSETLTSQPLIPLISFPSPGGHCGCIGCTPPPAVPRAVGATTKHLESPEPSHGPEPAKSPKPAESPEPARSPKPAEAAASPKPAEMSPKPARGSKSG